MKWKDLLMAAARNTSGGAAFLPTSIAGLQVWFKGDAGLTLYTTAYAGSGTITQSGTAVTGSSTAFLGQVKVGDLITATGISGNVTVITDETHLTLTSSATQAVGQTYTTTPVAGTSDRVTTWADQSGNGRNFTQASASLKPGKNSTGQNGLPTVSFDGPSIAGTDKFNTLSFTLTQPATLFLVCKARTWADGRYLADGTGNNMILIQHTSTPQVFMYAGSFACAVSPVLGTYNIMCAIFNGASSQARLNGGSAVTGNPGTASPSGFSLADSAGSGITSTLEVGEAILYDTALSTANETLVRTYLNTKWAIF